MKIFVQKKPKTIVHQKHKTQNTNTHTYRQKKKPLPICLNEHFFQCNIFHFILSNPSTYYGHASTISKILNKNKHTQKAANPT